MRGEVVTSVAPATPTAVSNNATEKLSPVSTLPLLFLLLLVVVLFLVVVVDFVVVVDLVVEFVVAVDCELAFVFEALEEVVDWVADEEVVSDPEDAVVVAEVVSLAELLLVEVVVVVTSLEVILVVVVVSVDVVVVVVVSVFCDLTVIFALATSPCVISVSPFLISAMSNSNSDVPSEIALNVKSRLRK